jgi:hypothetical protein
VTILPKKENATHDIENYKDRVLETIAEPQEAKYAHKPSHPNCDTCCNKCGERREALFGKTFKAVECKIFHNHVFSKEMIAENGCAYYNVDVSQKEICMNCEYYLGGGDWGLACSKHYHRLPSATTEACKDFSKRNENS